MNHHRKKGPAVAGQISRVHLAFRDCAQLSTSPQSNRIDRAPNRTGFGKPCDRLSRHNVVRLTASRKQRRLAVTSRRTACSVVCMSVSNFGRERERRGPVRALMAHSVGIGRCRGATLREACDCSGAQRKRASHIGQDAFRRNTRIAWSNDRVSGGRRQSPVPHCVRGLAIQKRTLMVRRSR